MAAILVRLKAFYNRECVMSCHVDIKLLALARKLGVSWQVRNNKHWHGLYVFKSDVVFVCDKTSDVCRNWIFAHEIGHATGHAKRLNRGLIGAYTKGMRYGRFSLGREERFAECFAAQLLDKLVIKCCGWTRREGAAIERVGKPNKQDRLRAKGAVAWVLK